MIKSKKTIILISLFILLTVINISAKSRKNDEKRFQLGFGFTASSASVFNFVQSMNMALDKTKGYKGITGDGTDANLTTAAKQSLITGNILGAMQIGFQMRMLAHVFFSELDIIAEPMTNISSGHCDLIGMFDVGIRCPKWIMPYIAVGVNGTFGLYPYNIETVEGWRDLTNKNRYVNDCLKISFGAHAKVGLDVKFKRFSVGFYCLYLVKDVLNEWTEDLPNYYKELEFITDNKDTYGTLCFVASQFRLGASICWYAF